MTTYFFSGLGETLLGIFGETDKAVFKPKKGRPQSAEVIFNARHQELDIDGKPYGSERPVAWAKKDAFYCDPDFDDVIEINNVDYFIKETKFDGLELIELVLAEPV